MLCCASFCLFFSLLSSDISDEGHNHGDDVEMEFQGSLMKRGKLPHQIRKSTVAKVAASVGLGAFLLSTYFNRAPPPPQYQMEKRLLNDEVEMVKRQDGMPKPHKMVSLRKAGLLTLGAGIVGYLTQTAMHPIHDEYANPPQRRELLEEEEVNNYDGLMKRREQVSWDSSSSSITRSSEDYQPHQYQALISKSPNGEELKLYTKSGKVIDYDKHHDEDWYQKHHKYAARGGEK